MPKRIVFCSDGTWQNPADRTNVYRLYSSLAVSSDQTTLYDDGIGADATGLDRLLEGAFATNLFQKVTSAYTKIAHVYEPGDQLYLFGFSRGAYTVRALAGFMINCGLPTGTFTDNAVTQLFAAYRNPATREAAIAAVAGSADCPAGLTQPIVTMIGVWDTVGALGIPAIFGGIDVNKYGFLDTTLHPCIQNAVHCLSLDEVRAQFPATLWTAPTPPNPNQTIDQVWFSGCHGDVGGGLQQGGPVDGGTRLCDITMGYMVAKAQSLGLTFDPATLAKYAALPAEYALDAINASWKALDGPAKWRPVPAQSRIANSVALRIQYALTYQPGNLTLVRDSTAGTCTLDSSYPQIPIVTPTAV